MVHNLYSIDGHRQDHVVLRVKMGSFQYGKNAFENQYESSISDFLSFKNNFLNII